MDLLSGFQQRNKPKGHGSVDIPLNQDDYLLHLQRAVTFSELAGLGTLTCCLYVNYTFGAHVQVAGD